MKDGIFKMSKRKKGLDGRMNEQIFIYMCEGTNERISKKKKHEKRRNKNDEPNKQQRIERNVRIKERKKELQHKYEKGKKKEQNQTLHSHAPPSSLSHAHFRVNTC